MHKDEIKGSAKEARGHVKDAVGKVTGDEKLRADGALDKADYDRTVKTLLGGGSDPVISKEPTGAFTTEITDAALK